MKKICIIPARGGSKRIPGKNIKSFLGKPIIAYSIEAALQSDLFDEVMVSTDDLEIKKIAEHYGAQVPFLRSPKNANDHATIVDVLLEVVTQYKSKGKFFDTLCCIFPCAPFVSIERLKEAFTVMIKNDLNCVFPVMPFSFPIQRALKLEGIKPKFLFPENEMTRSQDLEETFHDVGQFYFIKTGNIFKTRRIVNEKTGVIKISELDAQDIDNEVDWKLAEIKYKLLNG